MNKISLMPGKHLSVSILQDEEELGLNGKTISELDEDNNHHFLKSQQSRAILM